MKRLLIAIAIAALMCPSVALAQHRGEFHHPGGGWHHPGGGWHHGPGAGGVGGLLGGLIIGNAIGNLFRPQQEVVVVPQQQVPEMSPAQWNAYCANKYRSWNAMTQTYTGYDGLQHPCV